MRALTHTAQSVERRDPQRRREISIRSATSGRFFKIHSQLLRPALCRLKQLSDSRCTLHGWPIHAAFNLNAAAFVEGTQRVKFLVQPRSVFHARDTNVYLSARFS